MLCELFGVHRSTYKYWVKRDKRLTPEAAKLHSLVKEAHRLSNGSAGARTLADSLLMMILMTSHSRVTGRLD